MNEEAISSFPSGLRALRHFEFCKGKKFREQQWRANRDGADPDIMDFERLFVRRLVKLGVPMFAHTMVRTFEEQMALFEQRHSRDSPDDGRWPHMAYAVDIVHSLDAWNLHRVQWDAIGHIGKEVAQGAGIPITWGGDFQSFWDPAHWELTDWRERANA